MMRSMSERRGTVLGCLLPEAGTIVQWCGAIYFAGVSGSVFELRHLIVPNPETGETMELVRVEL